MGRQKNTVDDESWAEVRTINSYAIFMGYLLMGIRGLGVLILTWTTVVLLGGFVSMLQLKDFWCLTVITLVQTAGVFDFLLKEKASDVGKSLMGLLFVVAAVVLRPFKKGTNTSAKSSKIKQEEKEPSNARIVVADILMVVQVLMLAIVLCPLAMLYVLGLYLSAGISLWRLIQHDYGNPDGGANLKPALNVLYSLAVAQGVVYTYKTIYDSAARTRLVEAVAEYYSLETDLVSEYLEETVEGCMKDPSFVKGRNLVTYAVELLMESKSRHGYISGVLILGRVYKTRDTRHLSILRQEAQEPRGLMKQLLTGSASLSHVVQRLAETFGPRSPYRTEIRVRAASVVANVADSIYLDQLPVQGMMIRCISSLLDTFEEYSWRPEGYKEPTNRFLVRKGYHKEYERGWLLDEDERMYSYFVDGIPRATAADSETQESDSGNNRLQGYKDLVVQGLRILQGLVVNEENWRIISSSECLLSKAMAPLISDKLHGDHHDEWYSIATESLEFINRFMATLGGAETTKLRSEISSNSQATIFRTLECHKCDVLLKRQAAQVLLQLSPDTPPPIMPDGSRSSSIIFVWILLDIFLQPDYNRGDRMCGSNHLAKKSTDIARLADKKMQAMLSSSSQTEPSATPTMQSVGDFICSLATAASDAKNNTYIRVHAATILKHMVIYDYTMDDENLKQLKNAMTDVMPKVLKEIVHGHDTTEAGIQAETEENNGCKVLPAAGTDLEQGGVSHDNGQESSSTQQKGEQHQGIQLQEALINLCWEIFFIWHRDLTRQYNDMAAKICSGQGMPNKTFPTLLSEARGKLKRKLRETANFSSET